MTNEQVLQRLRDACDAAGTMQAFADRIGVRRPYISAVLARRRPPGPKILRALGLARRRASYSRAR